MKRHSWYLNETMIPLSLVDVGLPDNERESMEKKLHAEIVPEIFGHVDPTTKMDDLNFDGNTPPSLEFLVGHKSWFIFKLLDISKASDIHWLNPLSPGNTLLCSVILCSILFAIILERVNNTRITTSLMTDMTLL